MRAEVNQFRSRPAPVVSTIHHSVDPRNTPVTRASADVDPAPSDATLKGQVLAANERIVAGLVKVSPSVERYAAV